MPTPTPPRHASPLPWPARIAYHNNEVHECDAAGRLPSELRTLCTLDHDGSGEDGAASEIIRRYNAYPGLVAENAALREALRFAGERLSAILNRDDAAAVAVAQRIRAALAARSQESA